MVTARPDLGDASLHAGAIERDYPRLRQDGQDLWPYLDDLHHAFVFMLYHVTMKHKAPNDFRVGKRNDQLCSTRLSVPHRWNAKRVAQAVKSRKNAIDFGDQKTGLMDVEIVILRILV
jgi:hypothetical protein